MKYTYDRASATYQRDGKTVPRETVRADAEYHALVTSNQLRNLTRKALRSGMAADVFEEKFASILKNAHIQAGIAGRGGKANTHLIHYGAMGRELKEQYRLMRGFANDLIGGKLTEKQALARAKQYGASTLKSFGVAELSAAEESRLGEGKRSLTPGVKHCEKCKGLVTLGYVPLSEIVAIGTNCDCGGNCRCVIVFRRAGAVKPLTPKVANAPAVSEKAAEAARARKEKAIIAAQAKSEKAEATRLEAARVKTEKAEAARVKAEKAEQAKAEAARVRAERAKVEKAKAEAARVKADAEKVKAKAEKAKADAEKVKAEAARVRAERAKAEAEKAKAEAARVKAEKAKADAEKAKAEKAKADAKPVAKRSPLEQVQEAHPNLKPMEAELKAKQLGKLEARLESKIGTDGDKAYRAALLAKEDVHNSEAALDRIQSLYRAREEQEKKGELSPERLWNVPSDLIQGWRGGSVVEINRAAAEYTSEIWAALPPAQRSKFIEAHLDRGDKTFTESLEKRPGFAEISKSKIVAKFLSEADRMVRVANGEEDEDEDEDPKPKPKPNAAVATEEDWGF